MSAIEISATKPFSLKAKILLFLAVMGPGLVVMLADTDAGSIIVAAQSGAVWGYKLLLWQILLMPVLFIAQELTVRLGLVTGKGHGELIRDTYGKGWAALSIVTLLVSCIGAIITELSGLAGVGALFGVSVNTTMVVTISFLIAVAWSGTYLTVERVAIVIGLFELVFLGVAWKTHPAWYEVLHQNRTIPIMDHKYLYLVAGNIGAVIMPWMIFYQQSAILDKGLTVEHLPLARYDTFLGAVMTQVIMAAVLITTAATLGKSSPGFSLETVQQISHVLVSVMGEVPGKLLFALGLTGAALIASIVVSLTAAWALGEITGYKRSLQDHPREAPWFYGVYTLVLVSGGIIVTSGINLVKLSVAVEVMNAVLLPVVLGFLYLLACKALPAHYCLKGGYRVIVGIVLSAVSGFGVYAGVSGFLSH